MPSVRHQNKTSTLPAPLQGEEKRILIRDMQPADIPAVGALAERIWRAHYPGIISHEQIEYMLPLACPAENIALRKQRFWLLYANDALAGYIAVEPRESNIWFIDKLYVDTALQRGGLGSALLRHVEKTLKPAALTLRVNRKNYQAVNFYFRHGFAIAGLDVLDIGNGFVMDDFLMKRII